MIRYIEKHFNFVAKVTLSSPGPSHVFYETAVYWKLVRITYSQGAGLPKYKFRSTQTTEKI